MSHLSTTTSVGIMVFYSLLTFFVGPYVTGLFMNDHPDQCVAGFLLGFTVSVLLWMKFGRYYSSPKPKV
jgi:predicted Na+-dependent transporter